MRGPKGSEALLQEVQEHPSREVDEGGEGQIKVPGGHQRGRGIGVVLWRRESHLSLGEAGKGGAGGGGGADAFPNAGGGNYQQSS